MIEKRLDLPPAALEVLLSELRAGERQPELWEGVHAAAARDGKEAELGVAYRKLAADRRVKQLPADDQADILMHAADFFQGVLGDVNGAAEFLDVVLKLTPDRPEAFQRLERRLEASGDKVRLLELYANVVASPPRPAEQLARTAINALTLLPAKTPLSDEACRRLLSLLPVSPSIVDVLEAHCRKSGRAALACELLEAAIAGGSLPEATVIDTRRRLIDTYFGDAGTPERSIDHVEILLQRDALDAQARSAADRLLGKGEVASRAAAALLEARRKSRSSIPPPMA